MKHIYLIGALLCASQTLMAQDKPKVLFSGTPWSVTGISQNDKWLTGGRQYAEAYRYNTETAELELVPPSDDVASGSSEQAVSSIMDDGTMVGVDDYGAPSILRTVEKRWENLPTPDGFYLEGQASSANSCTSDGKYITGFVSLRPEDTPYRIAPVLWTKGDDGQYTVSILPEPATDFLGEKFQYTSPRSISEDGTRILGPIVDRAGKAPMPLVWNKDAATGQWTCEMPILKYKYNLDRYKEIKKEEPDFNSYITLKPGEKGYLAQVYAYQDAEAEWLYKLYSEGETGMDFSATPIMSRNGRYMAGEGARFTYSLAEDSKGRKSVQVDGPTFPAYFDFETGDYVELASHDGWSTVGISNNADIITTDGYDIYLILRYDQTHIISIGQWLKDNYGMDLGDILPANIVTNKKPRISASGKLLVGVYATQTDEGDLDTQEMYCIKLPKTVTAIMKTLDTPSDARIAVSGSQLSFSGEATGIRVFDMGGRLVYSHAGAATSVDAGLPGGVYVAKANIGGHEVTSKFYVKK